jgi:pimeloyl-ACP methyl ester carboxylesterase
MRTLFPQHFRVDSGGDQQTRPEKNGRNRGGRRNLWKTGLQGSTSRGTFRLRPHECSCAQGVWHVEHSMGGWVVGAIAVRFEGWTYESILGTYSGVVSLVGDAGGGGRRCQEEWLQRAKMVARTSSSTSRQSSPRSSAAIHERRSISAAQVVCTSLSDLSRPASATGGTPSQGPNLFLDGKPAPLSTSTTGRRAKAEPLGYLVAPGFPLNVSRQKVVAVL